jgi:hypothetical protein
MLKLSVLHLNFLKSKSFILFFLQVKIIKIVFFELVSTNQLDKSLFRSWSSWDDIVHWLGSGHSIFSLINLGVGVTYVVTYFNVHFHLFPVIPDLTLLLALVIEIKLSYIFNIIIFIIQLNVELIWTHLNSSV